MNRILKYLRSEGGWITGAMMLGSMVMNGVMGSQSAKKAAKLSHKTGEEQNLQDFLGAGQEVTNPLNEQQAKMSEGLDKGMAAAEGGGLYPAIGEAFSQRPNSSELDAIAAQEKNLKNQALNTGARGGLLKQQMFEASKNAATNKLAVQENARQNALQRAFQVFAPMAPSQNANAQLNQQQLSGLGTEAQLGVARNKMELGGATQDAQGGGGGLGSILGTMGPMLSSFFPNGAGPAFRMASASMGGDPYGVSGLYDTSV